MKSLLFSVLILGQVFCFAQSTEKVELKADMVFRICKKQADNTLRCETPPVSLKTITFNLISTGPGSPAMGSHEFRAKHERFKYEVSVFVKKFAQGADSFYDVSIWFGSMYNNDSATYRLTVLGGTKVKNLASINEMYFNAEELEDRGVLISPMLTLAAP